MIIIRVRQICRQGAFLMLIDMHNYIEIRDKDRGGLPRYV